MLYHPYTYGPSANRILPGMASAYGTHLPPQAKYPSIDPRATVRNSWILGDVTIGPWVHIVNATIRADEGSPFFIGASSNIQDGVVLHGHNTFNNGQSVLENLVTVPNRGQFSIYVGEYVSVAHQALLHGPVYIGSNSFIGFKSTIHKAKIGRNVEIGAHSYIANVTIPDNTAIAPGSIITRPEDIGRYKTQRLGKNEKISAINTELAQAYQGMTYFC
jgi:carbonic anhydrase/acetyltransferase-like protein (isoleucine patch superfamily)